MKKEERQMLIQQQETLIQQQEEILSSSDYKAHKNHEAMLDFMVKKFPELKKELPYDPEELHAANNAARNTINSAQEEIERLLAVETEPEEENNIPEE